jgi:hypothetical protein
MMNESDGRKLALLLEDTLVGEPEQNRRVLERLRRDFPELSWECIQHCPPIFMAGSRS